MGENEELIYIRDLNARDPFILVDKKEKKYYLYTNKPPKEANGRPAIACHVSTDLKWWTKKKIVFQCDENFWGPLDYWAPEVHMWKGKYYLFCSFRNVGGYRRCQCLVADKLDGPFIPMINKPVTPEGWHCLDGTLYVDRSAKPWMVFCHEWTQVQDGQMVATALSDDLSEAVGEPVILFRASEAPWKGTPNKGEYPPVVGWGRITDGPFMYRAKNGELLMLWSSFSSTGYTIGYARSKSGEITGQWIQETEPIYSQDGGHGMIFTDLDGKLVLTIHSPNVNGKERILLFDMDDCDGKLRIINERTGNWLLNRYTELGGKKA